MHPGKEDVVGGDVFKEWRQIDVPVEEGSDVRKQLGLSLKSANRGREHNGARDEQVVGWDVWDEHLSVSEFDAISEHGRAPWHPYGKPCRPFLRIVDELNERPVGQCAGNGRRRSGRHEQIVRPTFAVREGSRQASAPTVAPVVHCQLVEQ